MKKYLAVVGVWLFVLVGLIGSAQAEVNRLKLMRLVWLTRPFGWAGLVYAKDEKEMVVGSDKDLKGITARKITWKKDEAKMVLVPEGGSLMGSTDGTDDEKPMHTVYLDAFYMDSYEVTNAQYQQFVRDTGHRQPAYWSNPRFNSPQQPVVGVNWFDATTYAVWAKKKLSTEAEWEKSTQGELSGKT